MPIPLNFESDEEFLARDVYHYLEPIGEILPRCLLERGFEFLIPGQMSQPIFGSAGDRTQSENRTPKIEHRCLTEISC